MTTDYGIHKRMKADDYRAIPAWSKSSMYDYLFHRQHKPVPLSRAEVYAIGQVIHLWCQGYDLEPLVEWIPNYDMRTDRDKYVDAWQNAGKPFAIREKHKIHVERLTLYQDDEGVLGTRTFCQQNPDRVEVVFLEQHPSGVDVKGMVDLVGTNQTLIDFKTSSCVGPTQFERSIRDYYYAEQAALYLWGMNAAMDRLGKPLRFTRFRLIVISKDPRSERPAWTFDWEIDDPDIKRADKLNTAILKHIKESEDGRHNRLDPADRDYADDHRTSLIECGASPGQ